MEHSILSPGVYVAPDAIVRDSIVMFDAHVGAGSVLDQVIVDEEAVIVPGAVVGHGDDFPANRREPERLYAGIALVGNRAQVPMRMTIGRNCLVGPGVAAEDFGRRRIRIAAER